MTTELDTLKERRAEIERRIAELKAMHGALYTPGITLVPQAGPPPNEIDQEVAELEGAMVELDSAIAALAERA